MNRILSLLFFPLMLGLAGCPPTNTTQKFVGSGMDMFAPQVLRIHPLTRVVTADAAAGRKTVEVRVELADQFGDTTKGVGVLSFTIRRAGVLTSSVLVRWDVAIDAPAENKKHWDPITRTYLFRPPADFALPADLEDKDVIVSATLTTPGSQTIAHELRMK